MKIISTIVVSAAILAITSPVKAECKPCMMHLQPQKDLNTQQAWPCVLMMEKMHQDMKALMGQVKDRQLKKQMHLMAVKMAKMKDKMKKMHSQKQPMMANMDDPMMKENMTHMMEQMKMLHAELDVMRGKLKDPNQQNKMMNMMMDLDVAQKDMVL
jgi:hypothetical protein